MFGTACIVVTWKTVGLLVFASVTAIYAGMYIERWLNWRRYIKGMEQENRTRRRDTPDF